MRSVVIGLCLASSSLSTLHAHRQEQVPIVREIRTSTTPLLSQWNAFVRMAEFDGQSYVALSQAAALFNGHLRWYPVSKSVDMTVDGKKVSFFYNSSRVLLNGKASKLNRATIKNDGGFWVPAEFFGSSAFFGLTGSKLAWSPKPDVSKPQPVKTKPVVQAAEPVATLSPAPVTAISPAPASVKNRVVHRIVIDPGHGGKDPGAVGVHGAEEKTLNLLMAQELADALREKHDFEVLLTRMDDTFVPLSDRALLANRHNADLFISIHCNASLSSKLNGFEVYFLSEKASDSHADAVARLENAVLALEGKEVPSTSQVQAMLRSLVKNANINDASALGSLVDRHVGERLSASSLGVKQAAFHVLRGAEMPAILIETGFLSNAKEERRLLDSAYRRQLISGIIAAILAYDDRKQKERR